MASRFDLGLERSPRKATVEKSESGPFLRGSDKMREGTCSRRNLEIFRHVWGEMRDRFSRPASTDLCWTRLTWRRETSSALAVEDCSRRRWPMRVGGGRLLRGSDGGEGMMGWDEPGDRGWGSCEVWSPGWGAPWWDPRQPSAALSSPGGLSVAEQQSGPGAGAGRAGGPSPP